MMDLLKEDLDRLLSYNTKMEVKIQDKKLGLTEIFLKLGIIAYIVVYVFGIEEGYLAYEQARGVATTQVSGDVLAISSGSTEKRYFSADELVYPPLENGNIFLTTKLDVYRQTRKVCEDVAMPCTEVGHCSKNVNAECTENGFCKEPSWCSDGPPQVYALDVGHFQIWVKSAIQFYQLDKINGESKIFGAVDQPQPTLWPNEGFNTFLVADLLQLCDPPVRFEEVRELGAAIEVQFVYDCKVNGKPEDCPSKIVARRIDAQLDEDHIGFNFAYPEYTSPTTRRLNDVRGLRFYLRTTGTGSQPDVTVAVMMISTGIALLGFAPALTDYFLERCFKNSQKYRARKFEISEDFSDLPPPKSKAAAAGLCGAAEPESEEEEEDEF
jgi:hypothetical protein